MAQKLKKVYIILADGREEFLGFTDRLYDWFFYAEDRRITPFSGSEDYSIMHNIYNAKFDQLVTYKTV